MNGMPNPREEGSISDDEDDDTRGVIKLWGVMVVDKIHGAGTPKAGYVFSFQNVSGLVLVLTCCIYISSSEKTRTL